MLQIAFFCILFSFLVWRVSIVATNIKVFF